MRSAQLLSLVLIAPLRDRLACENALETVRITVLFVALAQASLVDGLRDLASQGHTEADETLRVNDGLPPALVSAYPELRPQEGRSTTFPLTGYRVG